MSLWSLEDREERRRGGFEARSLPGFAKTFHTLCQRHFGLNFIENPGVGLQAIRVTHSAALACTPSSLNADLSLYPPFPTFYSSCKQILENFNKINFPIKDQKKKKSSGAQESVPSWGDSSEQQDPGNQTSGDGGGSCSVHYLFLPPLPPFLGTRFPGLFSSSGWVRLACMV